MVFCLPLNNKGVYSTKFTRERGEKRDSSYLSPIKPFIGQRPWRGKVNFLWPPNGFCLLVERERNCSILSVSPPLPLSRSMDAM